MTALAAPAAPPSDRRGFAAGARVGYAAARRAAGGEIAGAFRLGDLVFRLSCAGPALLAPLTGGLALERVPAGTPADLEVGAWDGDSTGVGPPACPFGAGDFLVRGDVRHAWGEGVHLSYAADTGTLEYADLEARVGGFWTRRADGLEPWRRAAPLRGLLAALATAGGGCLAHAAAVGRAGDGLLLTGPGGSGKSTTALAAAARGWSFCGDDFVAIRPDAGGFRVESLYATAKVTAAGARAAGLRADSFPPLDDRPTGDRPDDGGKRLYRVPTTAALRLRAIVLPSAGGSARAALRPASRAETVRGLLPSSLLLVPGIAAPARARLAALAAALPSFVLELGPDPEENLDALGAALAGTPAPPR